MKKSDYFIRKHITATIDIWHKEYQGSVFQDRITFSDWMSEHENPIAAVYRNAKDLVKPDCNFRIDKLEVRTLKLNRFTGSEQELSRQSL